MTAVTEVVIMTSFSKKHHNTLTTDWHSGQLSQLLRCFLYMRRQFLPLCMVAKFSALGLILSFSPYLRSARKQFHFYFQRVCSISPPDPIACGQNLCFTSFPAFWSAHSWEYPFPANGWVPWFIFPPMDQCNMFLFLHMDQFNRFLFPHMDEIWALLAHKWAISLIRINTLRFIRPCKSECQSIVQN